MHYFAAIGTDGRQLIFWAGKIDVSNSNFKEICDNLISKLKLGLYLMLYVHSFIHS